MARIPLTQQVKKSWDGVAGPVSARLEPVAAHKGTTDLSRMEGSEDDKISAMISQSTLDYDPSKWAIVKFVPLNFVPSISNISHFFE